MPSAQPTVGQAAREFLRIRSLDASPRHHVNLEYSLRDLVALFGQVPIMAVGSSMIQRALQATQRSIYTNKVLLKSLRLFFAWCRDQGYLACGPTAAELVRINTPNSPLQIVHPHELKRVLAAEAEVDLRLGIAFWGFAGIGYGTLYRLKWENIVPGRAIVPKPEHGKAFVNPVQIRPVLDAWLAPFYGRKGPVVTQKYLAKQCRLHSKMVGVHFDARTLCRSFWVFSSLLAGMQPTAPMSFPGVTAPVVYNHSPALPSLADARDYFGLTPDAVGLPDWPAIVRQYQANQSKTGRSR
ncbi:MAG TPA: hypothetical protein VFE51_10990 [Verrucomicrobiae bacterium]|nr:hypothetical protein [Verrucomicrobiae bacterium]